MSDYAISAMQNAIIRYINSKIPKDTNKAQVGTVNGKYITVGNRTYYGDPVTDSYYGDGDRVYCLLPNSGRTAAVIGKV